MNEKIQLKKVNPDNWRTNFQLYDDQKSYVSNVTGILARAYAYREFRSEVYIIYVNENPAGMAMYYDLDDLEAYDFSQFFIDKRYQGHGYGKEAAKAVLELMKKDGKYKKVTLCYIDGNEAARKMYESLGFKATGEVDEDEVIMIKEL